MTDDIRDCLPPVRTPRNPNIVLPRGSRYKPPHSPLAHLEHLHATLGIDRVVFAQPSIYGTDNSAILDAMSALNAAAPNRARAVVAISMDIRDDELAALE